MKEISFIDLFAGIGGIRLGFTQACENLKINAKCVFTSEIKPHAIKILKQNYPNETISEDITTINENDITDFDFLLGGFPCQAFSTAGKRLGFADTRGTLFFDVERILKAKNPSGFILENVDGLVTHDKLNNNYKIGQTFATILNRLEILGYKVSWKILNAKDFGIPQDRKRIYIVGSKNEFINLDGFEKKTSILCDILETHLRPVNTTFTKLLLENFTTDELCGKSIKDKRGGENNIHSWDIGLKGKISKDEKDFLNLLLKERRKKKWANDFEIEWMDGMPLTKKQISTFYDKENLEYILANLVKLGYLKLEHPKKKIGNRRIQDTKLPLGYNIVSGKMSFEVNKILDPKSIAPTLVAMDMQRLFVIDNGGIRRLSLKEGLRAFGYPEDFKFDIDEKNGYDLLGNTVVVPIIRNIATRLIQGSSI